MTNTHITIGGHKITTNQKTSVKYATINTTDFNGGVVIYKVVNGICNVLITQITPKSSAIGLDKVLATNLPKCGLYTSFPIWNTNIQNIGYAYIEQETTQMIGHPGTTDMFWCSFTYPVADDWVES